MATNEVNDTLPATVTNWRLRPSSRTSASGWWVSRAGKKAFPIVPATVAMTIGVSSSANTRRLGWLGRGPADPAETAKAGQRTLRDDARTHAADAARAAVDLPPGRAPL